MWSFGGGQAARAPQFATEPAGLVEYTNSSGAVISCRPQQMAATPAAEAKGVAVGSSDALQNRRSMPTTLAGNNGAPTSISWHLIGQAPLSSQQVHYAPLDEDLEPRPGQPDDTPIDKRPGRRAAWVRQDGSLVLGAFAAADYKPEIHSAVYRCCLANQFGALCSRPVQTRAGKWQPQAFERPGSYRKLLQTSRGLSASGVRQCEQTSRVCRDRSSGSAPKTTSVGPTWPSLSLRLLSGANESSSRRANEPERTSFITSALFAIIITIVYCRSNF